MAWSFSVGNFAQRARRPTLAVSPAVADSLLPLTRLANGYPSDAASFEWRSDGAYQADVDLNVLIESSDRSDAPSGWRDLLLALADTPGLPANPPDWGTHGGRTALRLYGPLMQEVDVLPGEAWTLACGLYSPSGATSTGVRVRVVDTWSGKGWDGATNAWTSDGVVAEQTSDDAWSDITEPITADATRTARSAYRIIVEPIASSFGSGTYVYVSANGGSGSPTFVPRASMVALIGHDIPLGATVSVGTHAVTLASLSCYASFTAEYRQTWRLDIAMPSGNHTRPKVGELWIGNVTTMTRGPLGDIRLLDGDLDQLRLEAQQGRQEVLSDQKNPAQRMALKVKTTGDAAYEEWRNIVTRGSRFGVDPLLLIPPDALDGASRILHGRLGATVGYTLPNAGWRTFTVEFSESPFAGE
ncbi:MAG TPA: hypothetical protein VMZ92_02360 [Planctomycetota bacterium]|nr:hypothetical protein [Planctomycetota bacterium]